MANVTDPLVAAVHGTDPQNLMEYITRQKIYDSRYWKEECFGLTAVNVLEKASRLGTIGGSFGGNMQPTKFLCLTLKLLQIQPGDELVDELIANEDFKYVRALGAFYKRLSGRPADIYESLEPLYRDYRKLRYRNVTEWALVHMDEFIHSLLTDERVCGIALPRLPQRHVLAEAGYLEEETRPTALAPMLEDGGPQAYLLKKVEQGSLAAKALYDLRRKAKEEERQKEKEKQSNSRAATPHARQEERLPRKDYNDGFDSRERRDRGGNRADGRSRHGGDSARYQREDSDYRGGNDDRDYRKRRDQRGYDIDGEPKKRRKQERKNRDDNKRYGTLFTKTKDNKVAKSKVDHSNDANKPPEEGSEEYWNEQRAKLGLKPLNK